MLRFTSVMFLLSTLLLCQCTWHKDENVNGGPCTYTTTLYPLKVIKIEMKDSVNCDVLFARTRDSHTDTISYYIEQNGWLKAEDIQKFGIEVGAGFKWREDKIKSGSCDPVVSFIVLENNPE
jgi:hypothetical protein